MFELKRDLKMRSVQSVMYENLIIAIKQIKNLSIKKRAMAEPHIWEIINLKYEMETIAKQKGYSKACKTSIPICKGECCKWHFPKGLTHMDFFIVIFYMHEEQQNNLAKQIFNNQTNNCPMLLKTGCSLTFEQRPILCTNAYPCFNDRTYWVEKEKKNLLFKAVFKRLQGVLEF